MPPADRNFIQSLANGLQFLMTFTKESPKLTLTELARANRMNLPTARRYLYTFAKLGFVAKDDVDQTFQLTAKVFRLGSGVFSSMDLRARLMPFMRNINRGLDVTTHCAVLDGTEVVTVERLRSKDVVNLDITVIKDGYHGDTSKMFKVGKPSILAKRLCDITYQAMWKGIEEVKPGAYFGDIGNAIQKYVESHHYSVVREYCGHGIGKGFHEAPQVLHYGNRNTGPKIEAGMTFTIEPMVNAGKRDVKQLADGWTVVTRDRKLSAQWEHTILVTDTGYEVLTLRPEEQGS